MGGAANKNDRKFLGFAPRELVERGRGARVIRQNPADFVRNSFELRPIHTAKMSESGLRFAEANLRRDEICQEIREDDIRRLKSSATFIQPPASYDLSKIRNYCSTARLTFRSALVSSPPLLRAVFRR